MGEDGYEYTGHFFDSFFGHVFSSLIDAVGFDALQFSVRLVGMIFRVQRKENLNTQHRTFNVEHRIMYSLRSAI
jgi:hypothetical protein